MLNCLIIAKDKKHFATIVKHSPFEHGVEFVTRPETSVQVGVLDHKAGDIISPHVHTPHGVPMTDAAEVLYVESGKVNARIYDQYGELVMETVLEHGDILIQLCGGHAFSFGEDCRLIEVKPGTYERSERKDL